MIHGPEIAVSFMTAAYATIKVVDRKGYRHDDDTDADGT